MKAVTCTDTVLTLTDVPDPEPGPGQLVLEVVRCGICGSDLHARHHADDLADIAAEIGYDGVMRRSQQVVLGHEFSGVVVSAGKGARTPVGTPVVSFPLLRVAGAIHTTGLSSFAAGGYAEQVLVQDALSLPVPNGLDPALAALTEPLAVGLHAVRKGRVGKRQVAVVIGCGPVGLAVIGMLKATGVRTVVAADFSPGRRALAERVGADLVVDPAVESPYETAARADKRLLTRAGDVFELAVGTVEKMQRLPVPWWHLWRAADKVGAADPKHPVVFECVGVPGVIEQVVSAAPVFSRVVVVGVCMQEDRFRPSMAINKEIELRFVLGYTPLDFHDALQMLSEGQVDARAMVTGEVGLAGVAEAFDVLAKPDEHAKILIDPQSTRTGVATVRT